jgi:putative NADPH-quinone reductase
MPKRILVVLGHPASESFCGELASAYALSASAIGHEVKSLSLSKMAFNPTLQHGYKPVQELEPDLLDAQQAILWAEHLVFAYPNWWGSMPALLKGFIDRVFLPDFAFRYEPSANFPTKLLQGRTAELIVTMDTPPWYYRWFQQRPGHTQMRKTILGFCGIKVRAIHSIGPIIKSSQKQREIWIRRITNLPATLK